MNWYQQFYSFLHYMRLVKHDTRPIFIYREAIYIVGQCYSPHSIRTAGNDNNS